MSFTVLSNFITFILSMAFGFYLGVSYLSQKNYNIYYRFYIEGYEDSENKREKRYENIKAILETKED